MSLLLGALLSLGIILPQSQLLDDAKARHQSEANQLRHARKKIIEERKKLGYPKALPRTPPPCPARSDAQACQTPASRGGEPWHTDGRGASTKRIFCCLCMFVSW